MTSSTSVTSRAAVASGIRHDRDCLEELPGSYEFHSFAAEIGADLPPRARQLADQRSRAQALIGPVQAD